MMSVLSSCFMRKIQLSNALATKDFEYYGEFHVSHNTTLYCTKRVVFTETASLLFRVRHDLRTFLLTPCSMFGLISVSSS